ncbi:LuxR C-terminal-related transcriptional regulator [Streptomyces minutiscleroticus]|uniref:LuxR C-terminal-related transcriptional regulator n=1 Tax=Streptomyces minutiscleroticus TaxID=68238 RepID=UPI0033266BBD
MMDWELEHLVMLNSLGLDPVAESVYRAMLNKPQGVADICRWLDLSEEEVRSALDRLSALALVRASTEDPHQLHAVSPHVGMELLIAQQQAELAEQQRRLEVSRAEVARFILDYDGRHQPESADAGVTYLKGLDCIRDHLAMLNSRVSTELLTFAPGGPQTPENMKASRPLNQQLLERGVRMRTVYLDSIRGDRATVDHAHWLVEQGCQVRTAPSLPNRMIIYDGQFAVIASNANDTAAGAVQLSSPGMITVLQALFESVWQSAAPLGEPAHPGPGGLTRQQTETLRLLALGHTDEAIAKRLGVSPRTARRIASGLMTYLNARSRFQAGVFAVQKGFLSSPVE